MTLMGIPYELYNQLQRTLSLMINFELWQQTQTFSLEDWPKIPIDISAMSS